MFYELKLGPRAGPRLPGGGDGGHSAAVNGGHVRLRQRGQHGARDRLRAQPLGLRAREDHARQPRQALRRPPRRDPLGFGFQGFSRAQPPGLRAGDDHARHAGIMPCLKRSHVEERSKRASRNSGRSCAAGMDSRCCSARSSDIGRTSAKQSRLGNSAVMDERICAHRAKYGGHPICIGTAVAGYMPQMDSLSSCPMRFGSIGKTFMFQASTAGSQHVRY